MAGITIYIARRPKLLHLWIFVLERANLIQFFFFFNFDNNVCYAVSMWVLSKIFNGVTTFFNAFLYTKLVLIESIDLLYLFLNLAYYYHFFDIIKIYKIEKSLNFPPPNFPDISKDFYFFLSFFLIVMLLFEKRA